MKFVRDRLVEMGAEVLITSRRHDEAMTIARRLSLETVIVGDYGLNLEEKLINSLRRSLDLVRIVKSYDPDVALSFSSPEAARVAFGLGMPHISVNDAPHAEAVAKLTIPISTALLTPWVIPKKVWIRYGADRRRIISYRALDPAAWLLRLKSSHKVLEEIGLSKRDEIVVVRAEEAKASYLLCRVGDRPLAIDWIRRLAEARDVKIVVLCRYESQREHVRALARRFRDRIIVPNEPVDAQSLLRFTRVFVGYGGTMGIEAALLGVPTISAFPLRFTVIERYLARKGLIKRLTDWKSVLNCVLRLLDETPDAREERRKRAERLLSSMEDPAYRIAAETIKIVKRRREELGVSNG